MPRTRPACSCLSRKPASTRASDENGGVFTCPLNQTKGLSRGDTRVNYMSELTYAQSSCRSLASAGPVAVSRIADGAFRVGWYENGYHAVRTYQRRELAIADYLLFSFGKGRLHR